MNINENLDLFECVIDEDERHFVSEPLTLSCSHFICKSCVPPSNKRGVTCKRCNEKNTNDLDNAKQSILMKRLFSVNLEEILKIMKERFHLKLFDLKEHVNVLSKNYELKLQYVKEEIEIRIESLKIELDKLKEEFTKELEDEFVHFRSEMLHEKEINDFHDDFELIKKQIEHKVTVSDVDLREYQNKIVAMKKMNEKLRNCNPTLSLDLSDFKMERDFIAKLKCSHQKDALNLRRVTCVVEHPVGSCLLQNEVVLQSNFNEKTLSLHKKGQEGDTVVDKISKQSFQAFGVSTDEETERVFIADWLNHRVLVTDDDFNLVHEFGRFGTADSEFNSPADVYFFNEFLYVCDAGNKCLKRFDVLFFNVDKVLKLDYAPIYVKVNEKYVCVGDTETYTIFIYEIDTFNFYDKIITSHFTKFFIPADELLIFSCQHDKVSCYSFEEKTLSHTKLSSVLTSV